MNHTDIWPGTDNGYIVDVIDKTDKVVYTMNSASKAEMDLFLHIQKMYETENNLSIEDFNYDEKSFDLYKKGKHPLFIKKKKEFEELLKFIDNFGEEQYTNGSDSERLSNQY